MSHPTCISCGMPMRTDQEHARADGQALYCARCATESGEMKSYDEVWDGFTAFLVRTQGFDREAAGKVATSTLSALPAWRNKP